MDQQPVQADKALGHVWWGGRAFLEGSQPGWHAHPVVYEWHVCVHIADFAVYVRVCMRARARREHLKSVPVGAT